MLDTLTKFKKKRKSPKRPLVCAVVAPDADRIGQKQETDHAKNETPRDNFNYLIKHFSPPSYRGLYFNIYSCVSVRSNHLLHKHRKLVCWAYFEKAGLDWNFSVLAACGFDDAAPPLQNRHERMVMIENRNLTHARFYIEGFGLAFKLNSFW